MDDQVDVVQPPPPAYLRRPGRDEDSIVIHSAWQTDTVNTATANLPAYQTECEVDPLAILRLALINSGDGVSVTKSDFCVPAEHRQNLTSKVLHQQVLGESKNRPFHSYLNNNQPELPLYDKLTEAFYVAIRQGENEIVSQLLDSNLLDANTPNVAPNKGMTPLLCAVQHHRHSLIPILIAHGARVNDFGICYAASDDFLEERSSLHGQSATMDPAVRTPLQLACALGDNPSVKLLIEQYAADDSVIAPDGQIALRLASQNGHKEIVSYLPTRRGGGYLRWKHKHRKFSRRMRKGVTSLLGLAKDVCYTIPKFMGKCLVKLVEGSAKWLWKNKYDIIPRFIKHVKSLLKDCWTLLLELPQNMRRLCSKSWRLLVNIVTERIPKAAKLLAGFLAKAGSAIWNSVVAIMGRAASLLHTAFVAVFTAFRNLTWKDISNGFVDLVRAIFIRFPQALFKTFVRAGYFIKDVLKALFGCVGALIWCLLKCLYAILAFILGNIWKILAAIGGTISEAFKEIKVFFNPKA